MLNLGTEMVLGHQLSVVLNNVIKINCVCLFHLYIVGLFNIYSCIDNP
jgi:hypothetical protein